MKKHALFVLKLYKGVFNSSNKSFKIKEGFVFLDLEVYLFIMVIKEVILLICFLPSGKSFIKLSESKILF